MQRVIDSLKKTSKSNFNKDLLSCSGHDAVSSHYSIDLRSLLLLRALSVADPSIEHLSLTWMSDYLLPLSMKF